MSTTDNAARALLARCLPFLPAGLAAECRAELAGDPAALARAAAAGRNVTPAQLGVMEAFACYRAEKGVTPTLRELAGVCGVSHNTVYGYLTALRRKGAVRWARNSRRSLQLVPAK